jgi:dTDP-4-amino-4,6-dideoxygalactose transaminase
MQTSTEITTMPLISALGLRRHDHPVPFPLNAERASLWFNARAAIWQGVHHLGLQPGSRVLVPAYCCGSELGVLLKCGLVPEFYRLRPDLTPDFDHLDVLCRTPAAALYIIHYFGFPHPMGSILTFAREHGLLMLEDNALGLYSCDDDGRPLGSFGEFAVFSFPKSLPLPDGGALVVNAPTVAGSAIPNGQEPAFLPVAGKMKYLIEQAVRWRHPRVANLAEVTIIDPVVTWMKWAAGIEKPPTEGHAAFQAKAELKPQRTAWKMSGLARRLMQCVDHTAVTAARRRNFQALLDGFEKTRGPAPLFRRLPPGCCPLFFPVVTKARAALRAFLAERGIGAQPIWGDHHDAVPHSSFPFETKLKDTVLGLPVHQDLNDTDMARIVQAVDDWSTSSFAATG